MYMCVCLACDFVCMYVNVYVCSCVCVSSVCVYFHQGHQGNLL